MTNKNLLQAMGHIDPKLIADAAPDVPQKKIVNKTWIKWASLAACFAVAIIIAIPFINNPGIDTPGEYKAYIFSSYDEFNTVVPDIQMIENLANMDGVNVTIYDSSWYTVSKSASKSGNTATGSVIMGDTANGVTVKRVPVSLTLTCDANGNLS